MPNNRNVELAIIHIAKKDLCLEDDVYIDIMKSVGGAKSGSSKDLSPLGRFRVIEHFKDCGWKPKKSKRKPKPNSTPSDKGKLIRFLWIRLYQLDIVKDNSETALRRWLKSTTRRYHPQNIGYDHLNFLPKEAADGAIEQLKQWGARHNHTYDNLRDRDYAKK